jgi:monovalent cation:H+ antiporter-2, CPA2 family
MESLLLQASIYLGAAVLVVPLAVRLGLGSVLGYLAAGILVGPVLGLAGTETADLQHFAEFGVVLMLFLIGLELEPKTLWEMRHKLIGMGGAQVIGTMIAAYAILTWFEHTASVALILSMMAALSSTAIVLQTLSEKNLMRTQGGRSAFSVLLTQDIAVIPMLAIIPLLAMAEYTGTTVETYGISNPDTAAHVENAAEPLMTLMQSLPGWAAGIVTILIVAGIVLAGHYLTRPVFRFVHAAKLPEMSTLSRF